MANTTPPCARLGARGTRPSRGEIIVTSQALPKDSNMPVFMIGASKRIALQTTQAEIKEPGGRSKRITERLSLESQVRTRKHKHN